jgi:hypothetical protein
MPVFSLFAAINRYHDVHPRNRAFSGKKRVLDQDCDRSDAVPVPDSYLDKDSQARIDDPGP